VTTAGPETEAEFRSGGNVCLAPPNDPDALAGSIEMLALDPGLRRTLAEGARRLVDEHLSVARMTDSLLAVLTGDGPAKES
jgi:glycosyltransferase involved in cell wall biosynthesis